MERRSLGRIDRANCLQEKEIGNGGAAHSEFEHPWRFEHPGFLASGSRGAEAGRMTATLPPVPVRRPRRRPGSSEGFDRRSITRRLRPSLLRRFGSVARLTELADRSEDRIQHRVELLSDVLGEETEHRVPALLEQLILSPVPALPDRIGGVLRTIQLHGNGGVAEGSVDLQIRHAVNWKGRLDIERHSGSPCRPRCPSASRGRPRWRCARGAHRRPRISGLRPTPPRPALRPVRVVILPAREGRLSLGVPAARCWTPPRSRPHSRRRRR